MSSLREQKGNRVSSIEKNIGILFIIVDSFPNEAVWRLWLETSTNGKSKDSVQVWFHAKYPNRVKSSWVRDRLVRNFHLQPEWGSLELTKTMVYMLKEVSKYSAIQIIILT